jgi:hypothetical protein
MTDLHEAYMRQREIDKAREEDQLREVLARKRLRAVSPKMPEGAMLMPMPDLGEKRFDHEYL